MNHSYTFFSQQWDHSKFLFNLSGMMMIFVSSLLGEFDSGLFLNLFANISSRSIVFLLSFQVATNIYLSRREGRNKPGRLKTSVTVHQFCLTDASQTVQ